MRLVAPVSYFSCHLLHVVVVVVVIAVAAAVVTLSGLRNQWRSVGQPDKLVVELPVRRDAAGLFFLTEF